MTDTKWAGPREAQRGLAMSYAPARVRPAIAALFVLDDTLASIVRTTREPIVGQMRLTWWYEALIALDEALPPAEPTLQALSANVLPHHVTGRTLAAMVDGWEALLDETLDAPTIDRFAKERGGRLFAIAATVCDVADPRIVLAGEGWALADLSRNIADPELRAVIGQQALSRLDAALVGVWPRSARALGALALLARADMHDTAAGSPKRIGRILFHRLTGR